MTNRYSDRELLEMFRQDSGKNSHYAFNLLVKQYQQRVYQHIRRIVIDHDDANDLVQNTFVKVWQNLSGFREDAQLFTWIYRIATNESLGFLKQKRRRFFLPIGDVEAELGQKIEQDSVLSSDQMQARLQKAILALPEKQRVVFNLRYFDEMKYEDMSAVLGTSVGALKASYHHAVSKIEKMLRVD